MKIFSLILLTGCLFLANVNISFAQSEYIFKEGLIADQCSNYGRQGLFTDEFAFQLYTGGLQTPQPDKILSVNKDGKNILWKSIKVNDKNLFYEEKSKGAYIYLTYNSPVEKNALLRVSGNNMVFFNGVPHAGDIYESNWLYIPVKLKKGINELYIRVSAFYSNGIAASLIFPDKPVFMNTEDPTMPSVLTRKDNSKLTGAIVVYNLTDGPVKNLMIKSVTAGKSLEVKVPSIEAYSFRKVPFNFDASAVSAPGEYFTEVSLIQGKKVTDTKKVKIEAVTPSSQYSCTFISGIDNSVQYYSVCPQSGENKTQPALFLSVHGAGVEAIGQARAYQSKNWGVLVAPTNRRPRGFNWEDWGRLDALEVLDIAKNTFNPDPNRIYLTGHSMGGHGTWYLGATFPGRWAAIAPCSGYPSLMGYGSADGKIPQKGTNEIENTLLKASNGSNVFELAHNYTASGIYVLHGDSDEVVSVDYARQMRKVLGDFHTDFSYYEYPGGSHWYGSQCVDWPALYDFFKWHTLKPDSSIRKIDFTTANPAVSSTYYWVSIMQQKQPLEYSRVKLERSVKNKYISGTTENVNVLSLSLAAFTPGETVKITLDSTTFSIAVKSASDIIYFHKNDVWKTGNYPDTKQKGIVRNGTFKEPFNHNMVFVYGTSGTPEENAWSFNKARFDAETWYYRGNGAVDIVSDKDFKPEAFTDRGVVLFGNLQTNKAYKLMLANCPILVSRGAIKLGNKVYKGDNYGAYFMWPRNDSKFASVAVISGTGVPGMNAANANQYFSGGSGFPDYMIFSTELLKSGVSGVQATGFYNNEWGVE